MHVVVREANEPQNARSIGNDTMMLAVCVRVCMCVFVYTTYIHGIYVPHTYFMSFACFRAISNIECFIDV